MEFDFSTVHEAIGRRLGDRPAITCSGRQIGWSTYVDRSRRLANALLAGGLSLRCERSELRPFECGQDTVALYLHNCPEYLESMLGAFMARLAPCNVNYRYVESELSHLFADMGPGAVVFHSRFAPALATVVGGLPERPLLLQVADDSGEDLLPGATWYDEALSQASAEPPAVRPSPDDLYVLYTGGTTGQPKGVLWRQADAFAAAMGGRNFRERREWASLGELVEAMSARPGTVLLSAAPFMHGTGQWTAFQALHTGGTVVIPRTVTRFDADDVLDTVAAEGVGVLVVAGEAFVRPLLDALDHRARDLGSLRLIATGGAAISPRSVGELLERLPGVRVRNTVGSSEAGPLADAVAAPGARLPRLRAAEETCVLDETRSRILPPGHEGVGWLARSGRIPLGYLHDAGRTERTFPVVEGRRMSIPGDRARLLADGSIELLGREATTINSGAEKIFSEEVEAVIRIDPAVRDVVVVGRPSERWGSEVVALVEPEPGRSLDVASLLDLCGRHLARYKLPKAVFEVPVVVRSPSGKVDYRWANQRVADAEELG